MTFFSQTQSGIFLFSIFDKDYFVLDLFLLWIEIGNTRYTICSFFPFYTISETIISVIKTILLTRDYNNNKKTIVLFYNFKCWSHSMALSRVSGIKAPANVDSVVLFYSSSEYEILVITTRDLTLFSFFSFIHTIDYICLTNIFVNPSKRSSNLFY